jgi:hypothetical protein
VEIVDEFVVTLGLDPSKYKKEMADFRDDLRRTKDETRRTTRDMEADGRRGAESFSRLKNEIVGLFLVVAGARSLGGFVTDLIHGAAETGRFAQSVGIATERVSVWEMAVHSMGGTAQDARASLAALNAEYTSYMLTGRAVHDADLAALGISAHDLQSPEQLALSLAERRSHISQREFYARLQRLGLSDSFIRTLAQGRHGVEDLLGQMERVGPVTDRDARAAQDYERQLSILSNRIKADLRPTLTWLLETGLPFVTNNTWLANAAFGALGGTVALVALRFAGLPGLIAAAGIAIASLASTTTSSNWGAAAQYEYLRLRRWILQTELEQTTDPALRQDVQRQIAALNPQIEQLRIASGTLADPAFGGTAPGQPAAGAPAGGGGAGAPGGPLARVRQTESGNNYNRVVYDLPSPRAPTTMTLGEIHDVLQPQLTRLSRGRRGPDDPGSSAIGAYQFVRATLAAAASGVFGTRWRNQRFSPGTQDRMAQWLYAHHGLRDWAIGGGATLPGHGGARTAIARSGGGGGTHVSVGSIVVYTPPGTSAHQARAVAEEVPRAVQRRGVVTQANSGLN